MSQSSHQQEYGSSFTASTGSTTSETTSTSASVVASASRSGVGAAVRRVRLSRGAAGRPKAPFGFSIRGGREYGTGFFVSRVEPASEAHAQGLRVGDQVVRVNGYKISDALHKEILGLISSLNYLKLKVRNVGMIPVKERANDSLTWRMIPESLLYSDIIPRSSPPLISPSKDDKIKDVRLTLLVPSRSKLGCGICKGPDWRPGIFVQFTKENGIARESGLRPGDQIMQCNGIDFRDIQFCDAVSLMKQSRRLDLWIRTGAGLEMFPGESSGYNSSASSATGDQSPSSADHKRLSIVKEETMDLEDRLSQLDGGRYRRKTWDPRTFDWDREDSIKESESEFNDYSSPRPHPPLQKAPYLNIAPEKEIAKVQNRTIINLSETGTTIQNNYVVSTIENNLPFNGCRSTIDKTTVIVDVHRSEGDYKSREKDNITSIDCHIAENKSCLKKVPSNNSIASLTNSTTSSLSNAISQEFQKRSERLKNSNFNIAQVEEMRKNKVLKCVDDDKKQKHDALMDEFKKAHKRMFASNANMENSKAAINQDRNCTFKPLPEKSNVEVQEIKSTSTYAAADRPFNAYSGTTTTPKENNVINKPNGITTTVDGPKRSFKPPGQPPPPPPMPTQDKKPIVEINNKLNTVHIKPKAPPPPPIKRILQNGNGHGPVKQTNGLPERPPATPTPDYDTSSLVKVTSKPKLAKAKSDAVEMESLESFKLNNPSTPTPRPPSTYFMKQQNGMLTMKKSNPHVSVTIGEYPTNTFRKQPSKLEFLSNDSVDGSYRNNEPVGSRLQSELVQTLSRSNLKKKTDTDNSIIIGDLQTKPYDSTFESSLSVEPNENFHKRYGQVILPQPPTISIPKVLTNGNTHNTLMNGCSDPNRITITMPQLMNGKQMLSKTESLPHNGILKHTSPMFINDRSSTIKISPQQKSIKFGQTTTVIGDPEVPLIINR